MTDAPAVGGGIRAKAPCTGQIRAAFRQFEQAVKGVGDVERLPAIAGLAVGQIVTHTGEENTGGGIEKKRPDSGRVG